MGHLTLTLLGPFHATLDGVPVRALASGMVGALLAYLAVEADAAHPRDMLAALLWPEQPDRTALARLRHTLSDLRRALGDDDSQQPFLLANRELLRFNPAADVDLDVARFAGALHATSSSEALPLDHAAIGRVERAVALYRGAFLEGVAVNSAPFEEWALLKREQLHWQAMHALRLLAAAYEARGQYRQAKRYARRQLELQPWQEEAHQQLMRALALAGQRSSALVQYQICVHCLAAELGVGPADDTVSLYEAIRDGTLVGSEPQRAGNTGTLAPLPPSLRPRATSVAFVSREPELARLNRYLEMALAGEGRVAFVSGSAGSGKTALMAQFSQRAMASHPDLVVAGGNCNAHAGSGDPYLPFREILQLLSGEIEARRAGGSLSSEHARRLWALLPFTTQVLLAHGPDLVGTFVPGEPLLRRIQAFVPDGTAQWERLEALARRAAGAATSLTSQADLSDQATQVLQAVAVEHPLLLLLDDLQWADKGSLALLFHLGRRLGKGRILVVGAYRPGSLALGDPSLASTGSAEQWERHPLDPLVHEFGREWGDIQVNLDQADGRAFVEAFLDTEPNHLGAAFRETLYQHTGGNPLFTVELLRGLQERNELIRNEAGHWLEAPALNWQRLPARVEAVLAERLDRLSAECQALLQVASVEGEEFTAETLARVTGLSLASVIHHLSDTLSKQHRLVHAAHLLRREPSGHYLSCYRFAHILFQSFVYDHLDEVARVYLHSCVAEALTALRQEGKVGAEAGAQDPTAPLRLARHWEAAGQFDEAATCLLQAGRRAVQLAAHEEAVQLFRRGLALLERLPESPERAQLEKQLLIALVPPLMPTEGWASSERAQLAQKALDLARQQPTSEVELIGALYMHAEVASSHGKHAEALDVAELLLRLARHSDDSAYLALGHYLVGQSRFFAGEMVAAISEFQQALAIYDRSQHVHLLSWTSADLRVATLSVQALAQCCAGYLEQGLQSSQQALEQAQEIAWPLNEAYALMFGGCIFHALRLEAQPAKEYAGRLIELAERKHLPIFRSVGLLVHGWAQTLCGAGRPAITQMRTALAEWQAMGHRAGTPFLLALLAGALQHSGARDEALSTTEEGLALGLEIGAALRADLYRLKGELLNDRQPSAADESEVCFLTAITEARQLGLKLLELRATTSLARLWAGSGRRAKAHQVLAELYAWFGEGFDTPDLRAAKALLDTLSDPGGP